MEEHPKVTCVCPTYGRFEELRNSLSCFLHQTYPNKKLLIVNDAPVPINCRFPDVEAVNVDTRYETLGYKRQAILEMVDTPLISHWDDDDLYLPWHLAENTKRLLEADVWCVKPSKALVLSGDCEGNYRMKGPESNVFEAMMTFMPDKALELGGYSDASSGQTIQLMSAFKEEGKYLLYEPKPFPSFVFRWANGVRHVQGRNGPDAGEIFARGNRDFGRGDLVPKNLSHYYSVIEEYIGKLLPDAKEEFLNKLSCWLEAPSI
jgi:hypothetical protein